MRIPWSKYETVLLIELYINVRSGIVDRTTGVRNLSYALREYATSSGIEIDDIFRNENGISMQLANIEHVFNNGIGGLNGSSKLFVEMVSLYKEDNEEFFKILSEAKKMIFEKNISKDSFFANLPNGLSPTDKYLYKFYFSQVEKYCKKNKIITKSLFEIKSIQTLNAIRRGLLSDKKFKKHNKLSPVIIKSVLDCFEEYCIKNGHFIDHSKSDSKENDHTTKSYNIVESKVQISSDDIVFDYFESLINNYPELIFTNHDSTDRIQRRCTYIYPKSVSRRGNVVFEVWLESRKMVFTLYAKRQYLSSEENRQADNNGSNDSRGRIELTFAYRDDFIAYFKDKLDLLQSDIKNGAFVALVKKTTNGNKSSDKLAKKDAIDSQIVSADPQMLEKISNILDTYFPAGCLTSSFLQLNKFKKIWIQVYESDLSLTDDELVAFIKQSGIEHDGKVYFISSSAKEMIKSIIDPLLAEGATIFYYEMLYNRHISEFNDNHIYSSEMLKRIIDGLYSNGKHRSNYLCFDFNYNDEKSVIACELHRIWNSNILMTYQEMYEALPFVPEEKIRWTLSYTNDFVWNSNEVYASLSKVIITEEEINTLYTYISNKCDEFGSVAFKELPLDEIVGNNLELSESALWDLVRFKVCKDKFDYNGKVIVKKGEKIALDDLYRNYSIDHKVCSYDELKQLSIDNFGTSRDSQIIDSGNMAMIRVDKETFVADDMVHFDLDAIDSKLEEFIPGEFTPLKDVTALLSFPACGYPWNLFVLESFCRRFSRLFTYKNIVSNSKNAGVIVRKTSSLSYEEILIKALSESNCISNEEIALDYLFSKGYLGRRVYEDISSIINKAKELKGL